MQNRGVEDDFNVFDVSTWTNELPLWGVILVVGFWGEARVQF